GIEAFHRGIEAAGLHHGDEGFDRLTFGHHQIQLEKRKAQAMSAPVSRLARKSVRHCSGLSIFKTWTCQSRCAPAANIRSAKGQPACSVKPAARIKANAIA